MKEVKAYQCEVCGNIFANSESAEYCENNHLPKEVMELFVAGATLGEINDKFKLWNPLRKWMRDVTKNSLFCIPELGENIFDHIYKIVEFTSVRKDPEIYVRSVVSGKASLFSIYRLETYTWIDGSTGGAK